MTPQQATLKPCPFCGGAVELERTTDSRQWWGVVCSNTINLGGTCAIQQRPSASEDAAVERWNRRAHAPTEPAVDRHIEVLTAQVRHERAKFDRCFQIMMSVHGLLGPGMDFTLADGRVMRFSDPNAAETLHHLSAAIKAIPEKLAALATPASPAVPEPAPLAPMQKLDYTNYSAPVTMSNSADLAPQVAQPSGNTGELPQVAQASQPTSAEELQQKEHIPPSRAAPAGQHEAIAGAVARGWCAPENASKVMDEALAFAIIREVEAVLASRCRAQGGITKDSKGLPTSAEGKDSPKPMMGLTEDGWEFFDDIDTEWLLTLPRGTTLYLLPERASTGKDTDKEATK